jgi:hypothetical protein
MSRINKTNFQKEYGQFLIIQRSPGDTMLKFIDEYTLKNVYFATIGIPSILAAIWLLATAWTFRAEKKGK